MMKLTDMETDEYDTVCNVLYKNKVKFDIGVYWDKKSKRVRHTIMITKQT